MRPPDFEGYIEPDSPAARALGRIDMERRPRHIAVIMDGNGRWAEKRRLGRIRGHRAGTESVREAVETSARLGIEVLTLYAFSAENWRRPREEIDALMRLLREYLHKEIDTLQRNDVRLRPIGRIKDLPQAVQDDLAWAEAETASNGGLLFQIALSYGGRAEIVDAARSLAAEVAEGSRAPETIDAEALASRLTTAGLPDPDLLVRTGGEMRVSNFLLWQIAYSEIYVTEILWPDFRRADLLEAVVDFQGRLRRFGGVVSVPAGGEEE